MGLFGSLFTGVSALSAQSQNTAIISNNIANVNTTGFKRSSASFQSLVTTESRLSRYSPGTVSVNRIQDVDQQGAIQQTSSATDAAISGNGFFPVKRATTTGQEFLYTRAGQFSEDASGLLRNASGFVLYAWPLDRNGDLPAVGQARQRCRRHPSGGPAAYNYDPLDSHPANPLTYICRRE